jgi:copper ion binding protein
MTSATYFVDGMTCEHCVRSVREEITALPGVSEVDVDLASGRVDVESESPIPTEAIQAAVEEAGYTVR